MPKRGDNIYKRKDNRWEGRYIKGYDHTGKIQYGYVYAKTYKEAKEKLTEARFITKNGAVTCNRKNFGFYCDEWLLLSRNRIKESSYVKYYNTIFRHIKPHFGDYLPQNLNTVVIEQFSNDLLLQGLAAKTVRDILTLLHSILKYCRKQIEDGFPEIDIIYPKDPKKEMRVLTPEEQDRFVKYLLQDMDHTKFGILLALLTGMRIGEICALRWMDISLEEKVLHVHSTMQRLQIIDYTSEVKTKVIIGDTKSDCSDRIIPLTEYAASLCQKMKCIQQTAYVLTGYSEFYLEPRALQYQLKKYTKACDLEGVHFHTLRHTFATRCVEVGFEIKSLSEILGHSSSKITLDRYVHSSLELKRLNMEKLSVIGL